MIHLGHRLQFGFRSRRRLLHGSQHGAVKMNNDLRSEQRARRQATTKRVRNSHEFRRIKRDYGGTLRSNNKVNTTSQWNL